MSVLRQALVARRDVRTLEAERREWRGPGPWPRDDDLRRAARLLELAEADCDYERCSGDH